MFDAFDLRDDLPRRRDIHSWAATVGITSAARRALPVWALIAALAVFPCDQSRAASLSANQARSLPQTMLTETALAMIAEKVVEVGGVPPADLPARSFQGLSGLDLALRPVPFGPGLCASTLLQVDFDAGGDDATPDTPQKLSGLRTRTVFKVVSSTDWNGETVAAQKCSSLRDIASGFFNSSLDAREISAAVLGLEEARADAGAKRHRFSFGCARKEDCQNLGPILAALSVDQIVSIDPEDCGPPYGCYRLAVGGRREGQYSVREYKVRIRYRGLGARGYGIVQLDRLVIGEAIPLP